MFTDQGVWYYIPVLFVIKNSVVLLILMASAALSFVINRGKSWKQNKLIVTWIVVFCIWTVTNKLQVGLRYAMPVLPFLFIWIAGGIWEIGNMLHNRKVTTFVIGVLLVFYSASNLHVYPNFFSYISELYRNQNPMDLVWDSDFDWGQNSYKLADIQKKENLYPLYFKPSGGDNFQFEGIQSDTGPQEAYSKKMSGYYVFAHTALVSLRKDQPEIFNYFYHRMPTRIIGRNIYVYKITFSQ